MMTQTNKRKRTDSSVQQLTNDKLMCVVDELAIGAFNAMAASLRIYPAKPFAFPKGKSIANARTTVQHWVPQSYEPGKTRGEFDVPYVLGSFFDRYISSQEVLKEQELEAKAAIKFIETNNDGDAIDEYVLDHPMLSNCVDRMVNIVGGLFQDRLDVSKLYALTGHGPNSTATVPLRDAFIHVKDRDISGTPASLQQFHHYLRWDNQLREILVEHSDALRASINGVNQALGTVVECTKTSFVPKSYKSLRTMCPESNTVAFFAQMLAAHFTEVLRSIGIDLNTQPEVHKALARLASMYPELNIGTIDWSTASDRIWLLLVKKVFEKAHPSWFNFMENVCRHSRTRLKFTVFYGSDFANEDHLRDFLETSTESFCIKPQRARKGEVYSCVVECVVVTNMFATMGNPLTFPLQTLIFYAFLQACTEEAEERLIREGTHIDTGLHFPSSFGDDGIVDCRAMPEIAHYAQLLNWKLNQDKSFVEGAFRESCGGDYYAGRYCRPFSPKRPPINHNTTPKRNLLAIQAWIYMVGNNITNLVERMGYSAEAVELWVVQSHEQLKLGRICIVPPSYPDGSGLRVKSWLNGILGSKHIDALVPSSLLGLGIDSPDVGIPFTRRDQYHWPYYSWVERCYSFKCITSSPRERPLEDILVESHYYIDSLKKMIKGLAEMPVSYSSKQSFFDIDVKGQVRLDADGALHHKECRLIKATNTSSSWS